MNEPPLQPDSTRGHNSYAYVSPKLRLPNSINCGGPQCTLSTPLPPYSTAKFPTNVRAKHSCLGIRELDPFSQRFCVFFEDVYRELRCTDAHRAGSLPGGSYSLYLLEVQETARRPRPSSCSDSRQCLAASKKVTVPPIYRVGKEIW